MTKQYKGVPGHAEYFYSTGGESLIIDAGDGNDFIYGSGATDLLIGGTGVDIIKSGDSDDTLYGDALTGKAGSADFLFGGLGEDQMFGGAGNDKMAGEQDNDFINGERGNDLMLGGLGADVMNGGSGNDRLYGASSPHSVTFTSAVHWDGVLGTKLPNGFNDVASFGDPQPDDASADVLNGGKGNDRLYGGLGNDTLTGGSGKDHFVFDTALNPATNVDTITDFSVPADTIDLSRSIFQDIGGKGVLSAAAFHFGPSVLDASDRIIYDNSTGDVFYDRDGSGGAYAPVKFATLAPHLDLTSHDFLVM